MVARFMVYGDFCFFFALHWLFMSRGTSGQFHYLDENVFCSCLSNLGLIRLQVVCTFESFVVSVNRWPVGL